MLTKMQVDAFSMSGENYCMQIIRKINALLMVGVVYAMSLPTAISCHCDIDPCASCTNGSEVTSCCSNCGSTEPQDSQPSDCQSCCGCECFYLDTPIRAWKTSDELTFTAELLSLTSLEPSLPVPTDPIPAEPPCCIATHNVRQSQLCVWRK